LAHRPAGTGGFLLEPERSTFHAGERTACKLSLQSEDPALPVLAMHHVSIAVPDLDAAVAWYSDIFV
jgi:hypothetical protein